MGYYETARTDSESLLCLITDVLARFELDIKNCRGQCYDGAANVSGHLTGLKSKILSIEPRAIYIHCFAHTVNLVVQDSMCKAQLIRDYINLLRELICFVRGSPKRLNSFQAFQSDLENSSSLRPFCPTRWCLRISAISSIEKNYQAIIAFLEDVAKEASEAGSKANGFIKKIQEFEFYFMTKVIISVFQRVETLNAALQKTSLNFQDAKAYIKNVIKSIETQREERNFEDLWQEVVEQSSKLNLDDPVLPRMKKIPKRLDEGSDPHQFRCPKERYRQIFF